MNGKEKWIKGGRARVIGRTAAVANYLLERKNAKQVDVCESQGGEWITIRPDIRLSRVEYFGFDAESEAVKAVFEGIQ